MESDVSILTCNQRNSHKLMSQFVRNLKQEHSYAPSGFDVEAPDMKNVFLSHLGTKVDDFFMDSPPIPAMYKPEPPKVPLDSVDTLLRNKTYDAPSSNADSDLNELLQFVSESSSFPDEKPPIVTSNSFWISNPSPPVIKTEEPPPTSTQLPAVDQIMKFRSKTPTNTPDSHIYSIPASETQFELPVQQFLSSTPPVKYSSTRAVNSHSHPVPQVTNTINTSNTYPVRCQLFESCTLINQGQLLLA